MMHSRRGIFNLFLVILFLSIGQLSTDIYLPSLPSMMNYFSISESIAQSTITIYFIGYGVSQLLYGPASDYYGRRLISITGLVIFIIGSSICFMSDNVLMLFTGRLLQGLGIGAAATIASSVPNDIFKGKELDKAFSYISIAIAVTPLIAPILGGYFQTFFGWRFSFVFLGGYALSFLMFLALSFKETNSSIKQEPFDLKSILSRYSTILRNRLFMSTLMCLILIFLGEILYIVSMPIVFQKIFNMSPISNGLGMIFPAIGLAAGSFFSSFLRDKIEKTKIILCALMMIFMSSIFLYVYPSFFEPTIHTFLIGMVLYMFGSGMAFPNCISICIGCFPNTPGSAGAIMSGFLMAGAGLWSIIIMGFRGGLSDALPSLLLTNSILLLLSYTLMSYMAQWKSVKI